MWNPEFLREGWAVHDTLTPDRLVVGAEADAAGERAVGVLREVYASSIDAGTPFLVTDLATAELVKGAANAFLATKISFINAMAEIAEASGADVALLADALGHDTRIGRRYLGAGIGFGGGCLPKDIRAFTARAEELGRGKRSASCAKSTRSTSGVATERCRSWSTPWADWCSVAGSPCSAPPSNPSATTSATPLPSTSPSACGAGRGRRRDRSGRTRQRGGSSPSARLRSRP